MTDKEALDRMASGNSDGLEVIIRRYTPYVSKVISNLAGGALQREDIEELASEVFTAIWQHAAKIQADKFCGYLAAVARNKARDFLRASGQPQIPLEENQLPDETVDLLEHISRKEINRRVKKAVFEMNEPDREIFLSHYYYGQSVHNIALKLQMSESAVKMRLKRGREKLYQVLKNEV